MLTRRPFLSSSSIVLAPASSVTRLTLYYTSLVLSLSPFDVAEGDPEALEGSKEERRARGLTSLS